MTLFSSLYGGFLAILQKFAAKLQQAYEYTAQIIQQPIRTLSALFVRSPSDPDIESNGSTSPNGERTGQNPIESSRSSNASRDLPSTGLDSQPDDSNRERAGYVSDPPSSTESRPNSWQPSLPGNTDDDVRGSGTWSDNSSIHPGGNQPIHNDNDLPN